MEPDVKGDPSEGCVLANQAQSCRTQTQETDTESFNNQLYIKQRLHAEAKGDKAATYN